MAGTAPGAAVRRLMLACWSKPRLVTEVFWFFFSKKNCFPSLQSCWRAGWSKRRSFRGGCARWCRMMSGPGHGNRQGNESRNGAARLAGKGERYGKEAGSRERVFGGDTASCRYHAWHACADPDLASAGCGGWAFDPGENWFEPNGIRAAIRGCRVGREGMGTSKAAARGVGAGAPVGDCGPARGGGRGAGGGGVSVAVVRCEGQRTLLLAAPRGARR
jgi:hypothetical protein